MDAILRFFDGIPDALFNGAENFSRLKRERQDSFLATVGFIILILAALFWYFLF